MEDLVYELDPKGDIFLILDDVPDGLPDNLWELLYSTLSGLPAPKSNAHTTIKREMMWAQA